MVAFPLAYGREFRSLRDRHEMRDVASNMPGAVRGWFPRPDLAYGMLTCRAGEIYFLNVRTTGTSMGLELPHEDLIRINRVSAGHVRVQPGAGTLEYAAGDTYVQASTSLSYDVPIYQECSQIAIPRTLLRQRGVPEQALRQEHDLIVRDGVVDMLFDLSHSFARRVRDGTALSRRAVTGVQDSIVGMTAAVLEESVAATSTSGSAVKDYLDGHLHDPRLSAATAAATLHISERTLYRLFAREDQTVASYIRSARLRRVKRDLDTAGGAASIHDVAARWGFPDGSYFAKLFRNEFGLLPSEYVSRAAGAGIARHSRAKIPPHVPRPGA